MSMSYHIEETAFERMYERLQHERCIYIGNRETIRLFLEAIWWMARSGAQWRMLPQEYGYWNSIYRRFERWSAQGVFKRLFISLSQDADMEWLMIDATIVRAHACAAGAKGGGRFRRWAVAREDSARKSS